MSKVKAASVDKGKGKGRGDAEDEEGPGAFFNHLSLLQKVNSTLANNIMRQVAQADIAQCEEAMVAVQDMFGNADKRGEDELSAVFYEGKRNGATLWKPTADLASSMGRPL